MGQKLQTIQSNFNAGEISPLVMGRVDLSKYKNACKTMKNFVALPQGGATQRPGTKYVATVKTPSKKVRLIPFVYSAEEAYILEFGENYIRFYKNGTQVMGATSIVTNGTFNLGISSWNDYTGKILPSETYAGGSPVPILYWDSTNKKMVLGFALDIVNNETYVGRAEQQLTTTSSTTYTVTMNVVGPVRVKVGTSLHGTQLADRTFRDGGFSFTFTTPSGSPGLTTYLEFQNNGYTGFGEECSVDDVSVVASTTPAEVTTTYTEGQLADLYTAQSADTLYICHPNHPPRKLIRLVADYSWTLLDINFLPPPTLEYGLIGTDLHASATLQYGDNSGENIHVYCAQSIWLAADIDREIQTTGAGRAKIQTVTDGNYIIIDIMPSEVFPAEETKSTGSGTCTCDPTGTTITFSNSQTFTTGHWLYVDPGTGVVEARRIVSGSGTSWVVNAAYSQAFTTKTYQTGAGGSVTAANWYLKNSPNAFIQSDKKNPIGTIVTLTTRSTAGGSAMNAFRSSDVGKYIKMAAGLVRITKWDSASSVKGELLGEMDWSVSLPVEVAPGGWTLEIPSWSSSFGYPSSVVFFEQRLGFAGTTRQPSTVWFSVTGDYENFFYGTLTTSSLEFTIASNEVNVIRWMASTRVLLIGTRGGEYRMSGAGDSALTPNSVEVRAEGRYGSASLMPLVIGNNLLFVQRAGYKVRELDFQFASDSYQSDDLTKMNPGIGGNGIVSMAYQQEPHGVVWACREDGVLLSFTYNKLEEVKGWARHYTGERTSDWDEYESCACIPGENEDELWVSVRRYVNGAWTRMVELFDWGIYCDSSKTYSGAATSSIALSHLEGCSVDLNGDGAVYPRQTVSSGSITVSPSASEIQAGLPFEGTLIPVPVDSYGYEDTIQGMMKGIFQSILRLYQSLSITVNGTVLTFRSLNDEMDTGVPVFTGDIPIEMEGTDTIPLITIVRNQPLPTTILAIIQKITVGD